MATEPESRYTDERPVQCDRCGWQGMVKEARHGYRPTFPTLGMADVEPWDYCPVCDYDVLLNIDEEEVPA